MSHRIVPVALGWMFVALLAAPGRSQESELDLLREERCGWQGPVDAGLRRAGAVLRESRGSREPVSDLAERLAAPGLEVCGPLLEILVQGRVPRANDSDAAQLLSAPQRELVLRALSRLPPEFLRSTADARLGDLDDPNVSSARIDVLRLVGTGTDLAGLFGRAPRDAAGELEPGLAVRLRRTCSAIVHRDPFAFHALRTLLEKGDSATGSVLLRVLGDTSDSRAIGLLYDVARLRPPLRQLAVSLVGSLPPSGDRDLDTEFAAWLEGQVDFNRPEWARVVLHALGAVDDGAAVSTLIAALECEHPGLRDVALTSLRKISGLRYPNHVEAWRRWQSSEQAWFERSRSDAEGALRTGDPTQALRALQAYGERSLHRRELALDVLAGLDRREPALREVACQVLARLGALEAVPALVERLADDRPSVVAAARGALQTLTGRMDLPMDPAEARALLVRE